MTYPTLVGTNTASVISDTFHPLATIPSGSAGDLILVMFLCDVGGETSLSLSGYTTLLNVESDTSEVSIFIGYRVSSGTDLPLIMSTSTSANSVSIIRRFSGWTSVAIGALGSGTGNSATVSSHTVGGSADRTWVSVVGTETNKSSATTPGLSNEVSIGYGSACALLSGTINTTSNTVSMGTYSWSGFVDWISDSVIVSGSGSTPPIDLTISVNLDNVTPTITARTENQATISVTLTDVRSKINVVAHPDIRIALGDVTSDIVLYAFSSGPEPIVLGSVECLGSLLTYRTVGVCKVWDGAAWVAATPKVWDGSAWVEAFSVKVYYGGEWVEVH